MTVDPADITAVQVLLASAQTTLAKMAADAGPPPPAPPPPPPPPGNTLDTGLLLYIDTNQRAGTTLPDLSGHGNHGTINGLITTAAGRFGTGIRLGTTWVELALGDGALSSNVGPITIVAWVLPDTTTSPGPGNPDPPVGVIFQKGEVNPGLVMWQWTNKIGVRFVDQGGSNIVDADADGLLPARWSCGIATFLPGNINVFQIYCDSATGPIYNPIGQIRVQTGDKSMIGSGGQWARWEGLQGAFEMVLVYDRVLKPGEIGTLSRGYRPKTS